MNIKENSIYKAPVVKLVAIKAQAIICTSVQGGFNVSGSDVEKGSDSDLSDVDLGW